MRLLTQHLAQYLTQNKHPTDVGCFYQLPRASSGLSSPIWSCAPSLHEGYISAPVNPSCLPKPSCSLQNNSREREAGWINSFPSHCYLSTAELSPFCLKKKGELKTFFFQLAKGERTSPTVYDRAQTFQLNWIIGFQYLR